MMNSKRFLIRSLVSIAVLCLVAPEIPAATWTGGGADANWSNAANWAGGVLPQAGQTLTFSGVGKSTNYDSGINLSSIGKIVFTGVTNGSFGIGGNELTLNAGIYNSGTASVNLVNNIQMAASQTLSATTGNLLFSYGTIVNNGYQLTVSGAKDTTVYNVISGAGGLNKNGSGKLILQAGNTYSGDTTVSGGTIQAQIENALPYNIGKGNLILSGSTSTLDLNGNNISLNGLSGNGRVYNLGSNAATFTTGYNDQSANFSGAITEMVGIISYTKVGSGTQTLSGINNTYTGGTTVAGGKLAVGSDQSLGAIPADATADNLIINNAALSIFTSFEINSNRGIALGTGVSGGSGTVEVLSGQTASYGGIITNNGGVDGGLVKSGSGTLSITGTHSYTGATTVSNGTLTVNGSIASSSDVNVQNGGTLGGNATVSALNVYSGGTISPGNSPGMIQASSARFYDGGIYQLQLQQAPEGGTAGVNWDTISITGALDMDNVTTSGKFTLQLSTFAGDLTGWNPGVDHTWTSIINTGTGITNYSGDINNYFTIDYGANFTPDSNGSFKVQQTGGSLDLVYTLSTVPEPSTGALVAIGVSLLVVLRRFDGHKKTKR